jgi:hypothetical protein
MISEYVNCVNDELFENMKGGVHAVTARALGVLHNRCADKCLSRLKEENYSFIACFIG